MGRRDRAAPNNLPRTSHSRFPPYLHDCNASLFLLGDTEHCCVNSPISLSSHASFKSPSSPPAHPFCFLYSHHPVFCLYECFNIKSIVRSLFFCLHQGEGRVVHDGPTPANIEVAHEPQASVSLMFYHILTSSVISTDPRQHGIYLFNLYNDQKRKKD